MKTKLIDTSSALYAKRMAKEINALQTKAAPVVGNDTPLNGRRIIRAHVENGCLMGRSLNGDIFPVNVNEVFSVFDGSQICASRQP